MDRNDRSLDLFKSRYIHADFVLRTKVRNLMGIARVPAEKEKDTTLRVLDRVARVGILPEVALLLKLKAPRKKYPTPTTEGFFWAMWIHPSNGCPQEQEQGDSVTHTYEVVDVFYNGGAPGEYLARVGGVAQSQPLDAFAWGPRVEKPKELE